MANQTIEGFTIPKKKSFQNVYQFKITLIDTNPPVWRRILIPENATFYELHLAIQNSMGWTDSHLHAFEIPEKGSIRIECPYAVEELEEEPEYVTTEMEISKFLTEERQKAEYIYDFGDNWRHEVLLEQVRPKLQYPVCVAGERARPPEDCGGLGGYAECVELAKSQNKDDNPDLAAWLGDWKPEDFNVCKVKFEHPRLRFLKSMED